MAKTKMGRRNKAYAYLLQTICGGMGYCGSVVDGARRHVDDFISAEGPVTADQFVDWVFQAEGIEPLLGERSHKRAIREAFIKHMGSDVVDASKLK